jgi:hypothetical protein
MLLLLGSASGCACPEIQGLDGEVTFRSCADPDAPLMRGASFGLSVEEADAAVLAWSADDPAVGVETTEDGARLLALAEGVGEVGVELDDGRRDRLEFEVAEAVSGRWRDPWWAITQDLVADVPAEEILGAPLPSDPVGEVRLVAGSSVELGVDVFDAAGRPLQRSPGAVLWSGVAADGAGLNARVAGPGAAIAADDEGDELARIDVVEAGDLAGASLSIAAWSPARDEADPPAEGSEWQAVLRVVVTAADGEPVFGVPVAWSVQGRGAVESWLDQDGGRADLATYTLTAEEGFASSACVVADVADLGAVSVWLEPDGGSVHADGTCGGQAACAGCSAGGGRHAAGLGVLGLLLGARRRRR